MTQQEAEKLFHGKFMGRHARITHKRIHVQQGRRFCRNRRPLGICACNHAIAHRSVRYKGCKFLLFPIIPQHHAAVAGEPVLFQTDGPHLHTALFHKMTQQSLPVQFSRQHRRNADIINGHLQFLGNTTDDEHSVPQRVTACREFSHRCCIPTQQQ